MYILDTDHVTLHQRNAKNLLTKIEVIPNEKVFVTVITLAEQMSGRLAFVRRAQSADKRRMGYRYLQEAHSYFCRRQILKFDQVAELHLHSLKAAKIRIGSNDLKIASIALANDMTVVTRNFRDFMRVPNLRIEDWSHPSA